MLQCLTQYLSGSPNAPVLCALMPSASTLHPIPKVLRNVYQQQLHKKTLKTLGKTLFCNNPVSQCLAQCPSSSAPPCPMSQCLFLSYATMGDTAPIESVLCAVLCTTLWALLWTGAPVWNPSVNIKCEGPLVGSVDLGAESHVELRCGLPVCSSSGGFNEGFRCGEHRLRELQWGASVGDSNAKLRTTGNHCGAPVWDYPVCVL